MVDRWEYAQGKHPATCTCVSCQSKKNQRTQRIERPRSQRPTVTRPSPRSESTRRKPSRAWGFLAIALLSMVVAYLAMTVTAPEAIDSLMAEWGRFFN